MRFAWRETSESSLATRWRHRAVPDRRSPPRSVRVSLGSSAGRRTIGDSRGGMAPPLQRPHLSYVCTGRPLQPTLKIIRRSLSGGARGGSPKAGPTCNPRDFLRTVPHAKENGVLAGLALPPLLLPGKLRHLSADFRRLPLERSEPRSEPKLRFFQRDFHRGLRRSQGGGQCIGRWP